jgi:hypothetical protein
MIVLAEPIWYWALALLAVVGVAVTFRFFIWSACTKARRLSRRIDVASVDFETRRARLYWTYLRDVEALYACTIAMERAVREHPDRVAALISEGVPLHDACEAVA